MNVVRNSILSIFGTGGGAVMNLLVGVILARNLAPEGFGQYALIVSTAGLLSLIASMGLGGASIYWMNQRKMEASAASTLVIRSSAILGVAAALLFILALQYEPYFSRLSKLVVITAGLLTIGQVVANASQGLFIARMQILRHVIFQLTPVFLLLLGLALILLLDRVSLEATIVATATAQALAVAVLCWFLRNDFDWRRPFRLGELSPLLRYGAVINLAYFLYMFGMDGGVILLRFFSDEFEELGYYRVAIRVASIVVMVTSAVGPLLFSKFASTGPAERSRNVERTSRVYWVGILGIVAALELISQPAIVFLYGEQFAPAVQVFQVLLIGVAARAVTSPMLEMYYSSGAPRFAVIVLGLNLGVMTILMGVLTPAYAALGASLAFAAGNIVGLLAAYVIAGVRYNVKLRSCFIITARDVSFILSNLRAARQRTAS